MIKNNARHKYPMDLSKRKKDRKRRETRKRGNERELKTRRETQKEVTASEEEKGILP